MTYQCYVISHSYRNVTEFEKICNYIITIVINTSDY